MCSIYLLNSYLPLNYWWCFSSMGSYSNYHKFQAQAMLFAICRSFIIGQGTYLKELRLSEVLKTTKGVFMDFFWCNSKKWKCTCTGSLNNWQNMTTIFYTLGGKFSSCCIKNLFCYLYHRVQENWHRLLKELSSKTESCYYPLSRIVSVFFMSYFLFGKHLNFPCCTQSVLSLMVKDKLPLVVVQIVDISAHSVEFPPFQ